MSATAVDSADGAAKAVECDSDGTCFSAGTLIGTANGLRPIETIRAGNQVWAYDIVRSDWRLCTVLDNFIRELAGDLVSVTVPGDTIQSTFHHPNWVISGEDLAHRPRPPHIEPVPPTATSPGRWVDAGDLQIGDTLLLRDGRQVPVENIRVAFVEQKVYNFSVAELKCYTVGSNQILVHNSDCDDIVNAPSRKISLGIDPHLDGFSLTHGADSWNVWAKDDPLNWKSAFNTQMNDLKNQVLFNLDGVDVWSGVTRGVTPRAGATDWELAQIFQNRHWWDRIKWIKQGREIRNPFE